MSKSRFRKKERLTLRNEIQRLFKEGKTLKGRHIRLLFYVETNYSATEVKTLFSVPKKIHRTAVKRNFLKRRMREAYRLNKHHLLKKTENRHLLLHLGFIYLSQDILTYSEIENDITGLLNRLVNHNSLKGKKRISID